MMASPSTALRIERYTLDLRPFGASLSAYAKRYPVQTQESSRIDALGAESSPVVLVFAHALSHHKETWEPIIERLFALAAKCTSQPGPHIVEAWTVDCPDHGESAALNASGPDDQPQERVSCYDYGLALRALVRSGLPLRGLPASVQARAKLALVGHSAGATSAVLAASDDVRRIPWSSVILVEPWMVHADVDARNPDVRQMTKGLVQFASLRRDRWASREDALAYFKSKRTWKVWDARVLELFVEYGLREDRQNGVCLAYPKAFESDAYGDYSQGQLALERLAAVCRAVPVHVLFGGQQPGTAKKVQSNICDAALGRKMASIKILPDTGHMAPQQSPGPVADAIWGVLGTMREENGRISRQKL